MNVAEMAKIRSGAFASSDELVPTRRTLLERLRNLEDQGSWQEFFDTYWKLIYCAAIKAGLSDSEAEDVVQEAVTGVAHNMPQFRYDPAVCSFKGWLMHITRCRIIDHRRSRQGGLRDCEPLSQDTATSGAGSQIPDVAAERAFAEVWDQEWQRNIMDAAIERVKRTVKPEQYQIFYLHSVKNMPVREIRELLSVSSAKIYVVSHRVAQLVKKEAKALQSKELMEGG